MTSWAQLSMNHIQIMHEGPAQGAHPADTFYAHLYNDGALDLQLRWNRSLNDLPGSDWQTAICVGELCYDHNISGGSFVNILEAGDSALISLYISKGGLTDGIVTVNVEFYEVGDSFTNNAIVTFVFNSYPLAVEDIKDNPINIYPNPATDQLYIDYQNRPDASRINVFDLFGRSVKSIYIRENGVATIIDIQKMTKGYYIIEIQDDKGKTLQVKKFEKY